MRNVVVAGAKPGLCFPPADSVYAANAASLTDPTAFDGLADLSIVASCHVLAKGLNPNGACADLYKRKFEAVRDIDARRIVLLTDSHRRDKSTPVIDALLSAKPNRPIEVMTAADRRRLITPMLDGRYPILGGWVLKQPASVVLRDATVVFRCLMNWSFGSGEKELPPRYRPSTGLLALLLAIQEHGESAQYTLSGIGLTERTLYQFVSREGEGMRVQNINKGIGHAMADRTVLVRMAKSFQIVTTEPELSDLLPLVDC